MAKYDPVRHHRRSIRLRGYDYTQPGAYFVTLVTHERGTLFDDPVLRRVAETMWQRIPRHFPYVELGEWVVMPNHIHGIIIITDRGEVSPAPSPPEHSAPHGSPTDEKRQAARDASPQRLASQAPRPSEHGAAHGQPTDEKHQAARDASPQRLASQAPRPSEHGAAHGQPTDEKHQAARDASPQRLASQAPRPSEHGAAHGQPTDEKHQAARDASPQDTRVIRLARVRELAAASGRSIREVELAALEEGAVPWRYVRNLGTIGLEGQARLLRSTVAVVGLGGLGGYVAEALARMGVGHLILIDGDAFEEHNLNRQALSTEGRLGESKAHIAKQRVAEVNSAVEVTAHAVTLTRENLPTLLAGADVVVDGLDRLPARLMLQEGAQALGIPMVHGSIAGFLGQVMTIFPGDPGLRGLYGEAEGLPEQGLEAQLGAPAATPMSVAAWEAQEVVKILTGKGEPLRNRLLLMDMESGTVEVLQMG